MTTFAKQPFNEAKAEAFAGQMLDTLNKASIALMTSIGHQTGLFDTLATLPPATSDEIAKACGLNERYVREWLGAMVTGRVLEYDAERQHYSLPAEHAALLTRAASPNNFAVTTQFIAVIAGVEQQILDCFRNGGGVSYSAYPRFHTVMAEESAQTVLAALTDAILPAVPGMREALQTGTTLLDIGCGSGRAVNALARQFPNSRFTGYDFSDEAINRARAEARQLGLTNATFAVKDVAELHEVNAYQFITAFDAIHDQARPRKVLQEIARALQPEGIFLMQDIRASSLLQKNLEHPIGAFTYTISCLHCMTVSLALGGEGLGAAWGEEKAVELLNEAGFGNVEVRQLPHDIINNYYIAQKR